MNSFIDKKHIAIPALLLVLLFSACASGAANIPETLTPAELVQRAQEASDHSRYNTALQYYNTLLDRNKDSIELVCTAEYEIAFIHYKQSKYNLAKDEFNALLERYNTPDEELMPQQFKKLAIIVLNRIGEKGK